jgi:hypothetical protein
VWDTSTGKLLKKWDEHVHYAVCPTRPVLAIVENNRAGGIRLGFWDFWALTIIDRVTTKATI